MSSTTFTVRIDIAAKERLEALACSTGRTRSCLTAEAIAEYLDANEWQIASIREAMGELDSGQAVAHEDVRSWIASWGADDERKRPSPLRS